MQKFKICFENEKMIDEAEAKSNLRVLRVEFWLTVYRSLATRAQYYKKSRWAPQKTMHHHPKLVRTEHCHSAVPARVRQNAFEDLPTESVMHCIKTSTRDHYMMRRQCLDHIPDSSDT